MDLATLKNNIPKYVSMIIREIANFSKIIFFGTSEEARIMLDIIIPEIKNKQISIIKTNESFNDHFNNVKIINIADVANCNNNECCIIILDYIYSLAATNVIFSKFNGKIINCYGHHYYYEKHDIIDRSWTGPKRSEEYVKDRCDKNLSRFMVDQYIASLREDDLRIKSIEIETINRCNGKCSFCPVNIYNEKREYKIMEVALFKKIISDLSDINYNGELTLFSNNEPLMDKRIVDFHRYARNALPRCSMHIFTNGKLLTKRIYIELIKYVDEFIIDNYSDDFSLNNNLREIVELCGMNEELRKKTTIVLRRENEYLTTRGGEAKNRTILSNVTKNSCALPFQQMVIRPDGKVSLCCNDPYGTYTLGDLGRQTIMDVWYGEKYCEMRAKLKSGRESFKKCSSCDTFYYYY